MIPALIDLAKTECPVVRRNCASAMRSMTCKAEVRQLLIASGAIKVILDDATNQVRRQRIWRVVLHFRLKIR